MADGVLEGAFYSYMYKEEQSCRDWNRRVLEFYVQHFHRGQRVLDVGCGEGQFLEVATGQGIAALGVDCDRQMVSVSRRKGLDVVEDDLFHYLGGQKEQFDGVFSSNLIEHLTAKDAVRFLQMAFGSLRPGGVLLVATPNPESLIVHLYEFWRDVTHVRLYSRPLLEFLLFWAGFRNIESGGNPRTAWEPSAELQVVPRLLEDLTSWIPSAELRPTIESPRTLTARKPFAKLRPMSKFLEAWTSREGSDRLNGGASLGSVIEPRIPERERGGWRRLAFALRRRLARFVVQTMLFEEFAAIEAGVIATNAHTTELYGQLDRLATELVRLETVLRTVSVASRRTGQALHQTQAKLLTVPREVFAKGTKPSKEPESA